MVTEHPLISVVVTCYNYARYVGGAIESALAQDYPHKELIVVNDGSSDGSLDTIQRYADRVRLLDQPNEGSHAAYNNGLAAASGQIVIFLDADDLLAPGALARIAAAWLPDCAKVQYDASVIDASGRELGRRLCNFDVNYDSARVRDSFRRTGTYRWPVSVGNAYSRWFVQQVFPLAKGQYPDGNLNTVAPVYGDVITIPEVLAYYRIHGDNSWSSNGSDIARLPGRITRRLQEIELMQQHANKRGIALPKCSALDHELAFLNYRLMARKLGFDYPGSARDSTPRLLAKVCELLLAEKYPLKLSIAHGLWFGTLLLSPAPAARELIRLRFARQDVGAELKKTLRRLMQARS